MPIESASYKDPAGCVFYADDKVYRYVDPGELPFFAKFINSQAYGELVQKGMMVDTQLVEVKNNPQLQQELPRPADQVFQHRKIEFISYPYEWPVSMCTDAALLTLRIQKTLLPYGLSLKDATPYNIQFENARSLFIDLASIEKAGQYGIWKPYNQFCQFWVYPLLLYNYGFLDFSAIFLKYMDGISLEKTTALIGLWPAWRFGLIIDYLIPALMGKSKYLRTKSMTGLTLKERTNSEKIQLITALRLEKIIYKIGRSRSRDYWVNYTRALPYTQEDEVKKLKFVDMALKKTGIKKLLDLGSNTGVYSRLAAEQGIKVIAIDSDMECIDRLYIEARNKNLSVLPLWVDLSNPSPAIGWDNQERKSFFERMKGKFDCVLSLALVHHLLITGRVPLDLIVRRQKGLTEKFLITEFVGPNDKMFKQLRRHRSESYDYYNLNYFKNKYAEHFEIMDEEQLVNKDAETERVLFLMKRKDK